MEETVLKKWDEKEKARLSLSAHLDPSAFQWFASRIDPWGANNQKPPVVASIKAELARRQCTEITPPLAATSSYSTPCALQPAPVMIPLFPVTFFYVLPQNPTPIDVFTHIKSNITEGRRTYTF